MSQTDSIWAKLPLKSPPDTFYGFFKNQVGDFVDMFPEYISSIQLAEGENFAPDSVMQFKYSLGKRLSTLSFSSILVSILVSKLLNVEDYWE